MQSEKILQWLSSAPHSYSSALLGADVRSEREKGAHSLLHFHSLEEQSHVPGITDHLLKALEFPRLFHNPECPLLFGWTGKLRLGSQSEG